MKSRFTTLDVSAAVNDLKFLEGKRVVNIYDVNHKTYIIKLSQGGEKFTVLFESGIRIHRSYHDCEKAPFPSSFSSKLRKHLNNRRLSKVSQLSMDRVVDLQVDEGERAVHVIIELYDRGNVVLTDCDYIILNILRPRTEKDSDVRLVVREKYPIPAPRESFLVPTVDEVMTMLRGCEQNLTIKRVAAQPSYCSGALLEHVLILEGLDPDLQVRAVEQVNVCASCIVRAYVRATVITQQILGGPCPGYVPYTMEKRSDGTEIKTFLEYHPFLFAQHEKGPYARYESFSEAVDAFYAVQEMQKQQHQALKVEKEAMKKLENVKKDQCRRVLELEQTREEKEIMADLIILNQHLVDSAIGVICSALAQKTSWDDIERMRVEAISTNDPVASSIVKLDLPNNRIIMRLSDGSGETNSREVSVDISMTAFNNSRILYQGKKAAAEKIMRTEAAAEKAIRNAETKAHETIKQVHVRADTIKTRKEIWFEKFVWFISSENYIIVVGKDSQQNELLVKRYLRPGDIYMHADAHGAASLVIRNKRGGGPIPPKTMTEAAQMAVCCSSSWNTHIVSAAWWVYDHQVSKVAPTGEYLSHGSFMVRGKKNFMPSMPLVLGFGILFRREIGCTTEMPPQQILEQHAAKENQPFRVEMKEIEEGDFENYCTATAEDSHEDYPDIQLPVPSIHGGMPEDYSIIDLNVKPCPKKQLPNKDKETQQYLEKKFAEERKLPIANKGGKRQKHKMDKIRRKYRDQDDDEREMRLAILGSKGKQQNAKNEAVPTTDTFRLAENGKRAILDKSVIIPTDKCCGDNTNDEDKEIEPSEISEKQSNAVCANAAMSTVDINKGLSAEVIEMSNLHVDELRNSTHGVDADLTDEQCREVAVMDENDGNKEEVIVPEDSEGILCQLTCNPQPGDVLLYAVPMVGPYQAFSNFKYKVKVTPGTNRKGKAGKAAFELFLRTKQADNREKALIRALMGDDNACRNIPKGCRISAPQLYLK